MAKNIEQVRDFALGLSPKVTEELFAENWYQNEAERRLAEHIIGLERAANETTHKC